MVWYPEDSLSLYFQSLGKYSLISWFIFSFSEALVSGVIHSLACYSETEVGWMSMSGEIQCKQSGIQIVYTITLFMAGWCLESLNPSALWFCSFLNDGFSHCNRKNQVLGEQMYLIWGSGTFHAVPLTDTGLGLPLLQDKCLKQHLPFS